MNGVLGRGKTTAYQGFLSILDIPNHKVSLVLMGFEAESPTPGSPLDDRHVALIGHDILSKGHDL